MFTAQDALDRRLRAWREKLAVVTAAFEKEALTTSPLRSIRPFLYRERCVCMSVIGELERLSEELGPR